MPLGLLINVKSGTPFHSSAFIRSGPGPVLGTVFTKAEDPIPALVQQTHPRASERENAVDYMLQRNRRGGYSPRQGCQGRMS